MRKAIILIFLVFFSIPLIVNATLPSAEQYLVLSLSMDSSDKDGETMNAEWVHDELSADIISSAVTTTGIISEAIDLDGSADELIVSRTQRMTNTVRGDFSWEFWMNPDTSGTEDTVLDMRDDVKGKNLIEVYDGGGTKLTYRYGDTSTNNLVSNADIDAGTWVHVVVVVNSSQSRMYMYLNGTYDNDAALVSNSGHPDEDLNIGSQESVAEYFDGQIDEFRLWNKSLTSDEIASLFNSGTGTDFEEFFTGAPTIDNYNMTSEGGEGCINWRTNKLNSCLTSDSTPTVKFGTDENANCAIGVSDINYSSMGTSRRCSGGQGGTSHTCSLSAQDALHAGTSSIYISCEDTSGNENQASTSGALSILINPTDSETLGRNAILAGVELALPSDYRVYTDQKVYLRDSSNNQFTGTFDKIIKWMNKMWAFNVLTGSDVPLGGFNISPTFYVLEMNDSSGGINATVSQLILETK